MRNENSPKPRWQATPKSTKETKSTRQNLGTSLFGGTTIQGLDLDVLVPAVAAVVLQADVALAGMVLVGDVELVGLPSGRLFFSVHSSRSMRVTFSPFISISMRFPSQVITMWFHSPTGFMAFLLGLTRS